MYRPDSSHNYAHILACVLVERDDRLLVQVPHGAVELLPFQRFVSTVCVAVYTYHYLPIFYSRGVWFPRRQ